MSATASSSALPNAGAPGHPTVAERAARGKAARREVPRSSHGDWAPPSDRRLLFDLNDFDDAAGPVRARALRRPYLGGGDRFDRAVTDFAEAHADQNERDHRELVAAVEAGRVEARTGI